MIYERLFLEEQEGADVSDELDLLDLLMQDYYNREMRNKPEDQDEFSHRPEEESSLEGQRQDLGQIEEDFGCFPNIFFTIFSDDVEDDPHKILALADKAFTEPISMRYGIVVFVNN
jgi:hypothetical protein